MMRVNRVDRTQIVLLVVAAIAIVILITLDLCF
jgi:hypothetical protein